MLQVGDEIVACCEKVVFQSKGLIRYQGIVIFVEDVLPQEEVLVKICQVKKSYLIGKVQKILKPSEERRKALCPYFGTCGGCSLQMAVYQEQKKLKKEWVEEALLPFYKKDVTFVSADQEWSYRRKIALHFTNSKNTLTLGYYARDNQTLINVECCPLFDKEGQFDMKALHRWLRSMLGSSEMKGQVVLFKCQSGPYIVRVVLDGAKKIELGNLSLPHGWAKLIVEGKKEKKEIESALWNEELLIDEAFGLKFYLSPYVFVQNYTLQSYKIYEEVAGMLAPGTSVVDLYCGVGILSQLLASRGHEVLAIESSFEAIELAKKSQKLNQLRGVKFIAGRVEEQLAKALKKQKNKENSYNTWIVNPPREGLSEVMVQDIVTFLPREVIYISCMPSTLARDIRKLTGYGYTVEKSSAYDMFPQTTHVETCVKLVREQ